MSDSHLHYHYAWQAEQWQRLLQQRSDDKLPHAIMLAGPSGIGKLQFAQAHAQLLLCLSPVSGSICGRCKSCILSAAGTHPDLCVVRPEDGSRVIKIDQVRRLTEFVSKTSQQGGMKLIVIEPVEYLNINAANALLKSLEEPSAGTLLLLVSHVPSQVMATIRSRCQKIDFALPDKAAALEWLTPLSAGLADPSYLLACAGGAPVAARALMEGDQLDARQQLAQALVDIAKQQVSPLDVAAKLSKREPLDVLANIMQWLQMGIRQQTEEADNLEPVVLVLADVPQMTVFRFWDKLVVVKRQLLSMANPNKQLLLEELLLDWQALAKQGVQAGQSRQQLMNGLV
jgi:DNA polymerase-3 subunit delta'